MPCSWWLTLSALALTCSAPGCGRIGFASLGSEPDGSSADDGIAAVGPCAAPDGDAVAIYPFDGDDGGTIVRDLAGAHDGTASGPLAITTGPEDCGDAASFDGSEWVIIPDSPDWDLDIGSVDLWVRLNVPLSDRVGLLSRDASSAELPGHFTLFVDGGSGRVFVRIQKMGDGTDAATTLCAEDPLPIGMWVHVGVNFGPPTSELYLDGARQGGTGTVGLYECGTSSEDGIAGNDNPWAIGASLHSSAEGSGEGVEQHLTGAIDHVRISSARRDFSRFSL